MCPRTKNWIAGRTLFIPSETGGNTTLKSFNLPGNNLCTLGQHPNPSDLCCPARNTEGPSQNVGYVILRKSFSLYKNIGGPAINCIDFLWE